MNTTAYDDSVPLSKQQHATNLPFSADLSARHRLLQQVILRDQVQTAIHHLIRDY